MMEVGVVRSIKKVDDMERVLCLVNNSLQSMKWSH